MEEVSGVRWAVAVGRDEDRQRWSGRAFEGQKRYRFRAVSASLERAGCTNNAIVEAEGPRFPEARTAMPMRTKDSMSSSCRQPLTSRGGETRRPRLP
jgi:hypothetical protein